MKYADRAAQNALTDQAVYFNTRNSQTDNSSATGTMVSVDGQTGRAIAVVADGTARFNQIASSNQLGVTSVAYSKGIAGGGGYLSGRTA
jgi:membrane peptidoglycan carboxypeptidase